jgi:hypothetical protein
MSSLLQDRFPFKTAGFFYCGIRVEGWVQPISGNEAEDYAEAGDQRNQ